MLPVPPSHVVACVLQLPRLEQLDVGYNCLTTLPEDFWKLNATLNVLHAEGNDLTCLPPEFQLLTRLQVRVNTVRP